MDAALTVRSLIQTGAVGIIISLLAIAFHFLLYLMKVHSSKSKLITSSLLAIILLTAKYLNYPISNVLDKITPMSVAHQNIDNAAKTLIWLCFATLITSSLNYFFWEDNINQLQQKSTPKLLVTLINITIHVVFIMIIMRTVFDINVSNILAASGLGAFILGWSAKPTLTEFFAGIAIQMGGKLQKNAIISINNDEGILSDFNWRSISITPIAYNGRVLNNENYIIPNSKLQSQSVRILRKPGEKKIRVEGSCFISPYSSLTLCQKLIKNSLLEHVTGDQISLMTSGDNRGNYKISFTVMVHGLKNRVFFNESFEKSLIHRFIKNTQPIGQTRLPWSINQDSEQSVMDQCTPEPPTTEHILQLLSQIDVFEALDEEELVSLINQSRTEYFIINEYIFHERIKEDYSLHILLSGEADAYQFNDNSQRVKVDEFKTGDYFGLQSFLLDIPHRISVLAKEGVWGLKIPREAFAPLLETYPQITESLGQLLAERKDENNLIIEEYKRQNEAHNESTSEMFIRKIKALFK